MNPRKRAALEAGGYAFTDPAQWLGLSAEESATIEAMVAARKGRERGIIFGPRMIEALLADRKTQTRRLVKKLAECDIPGAYLDAYNGGPEWCWWTADDRQCNGHGSIRCPYGKPGDLLWVKESHWRDWREPNVVIYDATPEWGKYRDEPFPVRSTNPDGHQPTREESRAAMLPKFWRRRSPMLMPRWASRLTLQVVAIRIERVQDISEADAQAEGLQRPILSEGPVFDSPLGPLRTHPQTGYYRDAFAATWDEIHGEEHPWSANDRVWVVTFEKLAADAAT